MWIGRALLVLILIQPVVLAGQPPTETQTYSGRVLRADSLIPIPGASVVLILGPCETQKGVPRHPEIRTQTTSPDGSYSFTDVPSSDATLLVYLSGFTAGEPRCRPMRSRTMLAPPIRLYPAVTTMQMKDDALDPPYGDRRNTVQFRAPVFNLNGGSFDFVTVDGYYGGGNRAWTYDFESQSLKPTKEPADWVRTEMADWQHAPVDLEQSCRDCAMIMTAQHAGRRIVISRSIGPQFVESSDKSAIFWQEWNPPGKMRVGMYQYATERKHYINLPWDRSFSLLGAGRHGSGYLVAYSVEFACNPDLNQRIAWSNEPWNVTQAFYGVPAHVCFVSLPARDARVAGTKGHKGQ